MVDIPESLDIRFQTNRSFSTKVPKVFFLFTFVFDQLHEEKNYVRFIEAGISVILNFTVTFGIFCVMRF